MMTDAEETRTLDHLVIGMYLTAERLNESHSPLVDETAAQLLRDAADILRVMHQLSCLRQQLADLACAAPSTLLLQSLRGDTGE
jgi:hypothetical protein